MKARTVVSLLAAALGLSSPAVQSAGQAQVSTISGDVVYVRPASGKLYEDLSILEQIAEKLSAEVEPLRGTTKLQDGDGFRSTDSEAALQIECASGATLTLSGSFDAILRTRADGQGCRLEVRKGLAAATTAADPAAMPDGNPELQYGDVTLGAASTMFGVAIDRNSAEAFVIDGVVTVNKNNETLPPLNAGQMLSVDTGTRQQIQDSRLEYVASVYARIDVVSVPAAQRTARQSELQSAYLATFKAPQDLAVRKRLTDYYATLPATPNAARAYQVRKSVLPPGATEYVKPQPDAPIRAVDKVPQPVDDTKKFNRNDIAVPRQP